MLRVETQSFRDGLKGLSIPPGLFVAKAMVVPVMGSTKWYRELVADLASNRAGLGESQMVGVSGASAAHQTRLGSDKFEMAFIAMPTRLADRELAFLDFGGSTVGFVDVSKPADCC